MSGAKNSPVSSMPGNRTKVQVVVTLISLIAAVLNQAPKQRFIYQRLQCYVADSGGLLKCITTSE